jgi:Terminase large subunit, T4likevirus-type, N-terminal
VAGELPAGAPAAPVPVVEFARTRLGFTADLKQAELLGSGARRGMVNCTRQWGKSTVAAALAVHRAYTVPGSVVVVAGPSEKQSAELVWKARDFLRRLGIGRKGDGSNRISLVLPNGSRIIGLPGREKTLRGYSAVSLMILDEAARMEDEVYKALRPMLAVGDGDLWLLSTPAGKSGFFYENWAFGGEEWARFSVPATQCSRIAASFLEEERRNLGESWFKREYLCEFMEDGSRMFDRARVMGILNEGEPMV